MPEDIFKKLKDLPALVQDYLLSDELGDANAEIIKKYNLAEKKDVFFDILNLIFLKEISAESLPAMFFSKLGIKDDKIIKELLRDVAEKILSPVADYLGMKQESAPASLVDRVVKKFNFALDEAAAKRFSEAADSFFSGARTKAQFKNTLMKEAAMGGLGMDKAAADNAADYLSSHLRIQELETKKQDNGEAEKTASPLNVKVEVNFEEEEKEAAAKGAKIAKIKTEAPKLLSVTEGVKNALAELNYTFPSSELQDRLKSVIDSRVRSVRTSIQTFEKLTQDVSSGGMGFTKLEADKVSLILNKYLEEKNKDIYDGKLVEIKQAEEEEKKKQEERERQKGEERQKILDTKYAKLTEGKKIPPSPPFPKGGEKTAGSLSLKKGEAERDFVLAPSVISASPSVIPAPSRVIPAEAGIQSRPPFNRQSSPPPRPSLEDINFTPKLFGPVEEIGQMTLSDFRKLSGDTKERLQKIQDKLNLLREESYIKYRAGLAAWKKSPVYGEYLKIINQAVSHGISLEDTVGEAGTLTKEEVDGIINSRIAE